MDITTDEREEAFETLISKAIKKLREKKHCKQIRHKRKDELNAETENVTWTQRHFWVFRAPGKEHEDQCCAWPLFFLIYVSIQFVGAIFLFYTFYPFSWEEFKINFPIEGYSIFLAIFMFLSYMCCQTKMDS